MEHRWGQRVSVDVIVRLIGSPGAIGTGRLRNVSATGAFVQTKLNLPLLTPVRVELTAGPAPTGHPCEGRAYVVRQVSVGSGSRMVRSASRFHRPWQYETCRARPSWKRSGESARHEPFLKEAPHMIQAKFTVSGPPKNRSPAQERVPAMRALLELGQSVWLDDLRRRMTRSGELASMIDEGLRGMTSNPSIFDHAISGNPDYDEGLVELMNVHRSDRALFQAIAVEDVREAADVFRPVFEETKGADGFVSIEVSPECARDTERSIAEARHLWHAVDRPNVMVKIPGTRPGWPAIEHCLREGININVTLLFSVEHYRAVAEAYLRALEARIAGGQRIDRVCSVASMFVSRIDSEVDLRIREAGGALAALQGRVAIANARLTYAAFLELTHSSRWRALAEQGARVQRPLWASTGTKNPNYSDIRYVQSLIGAETISTIPPDTLRAFEDHGTIERTLSDDPGDAAEVMKTLADGGIDFAEVNRTLENEGIQKFTASLENILRVLAEKRARLTRGAAAGGASSTSG